MRVVFGLVLVLGIGLAGFAVYLAQGQISEYQSTLAAQQAQLASNVKVTPVFVVDRRIAYGEKLTEKDVRLVNWPVDALPEGAFTYSNEPNEDDPILFPEDGALRTVLRVMEKDEAVLAVKVTEPGEDAGVSSRLAKGMRAFALRVDVSSGVSGFLRPGDAVDVYWSGQARGRNFTSLIESNLKLLAVDQIADGDRNAPTIARTVTVAASPERIAALTQAQNTGKLTLSLVGAGDETVVTNIEVDQQQLLGIKEEVVEIIEQDVEEVCHVIERKGAERIKTVVDCPE